MAQISQYDRGRFASSAVGVPKEDNSGQILAKGVESIGNAFTARQKVIDEATLASSIYKFRRSDILLNTESRQQFRDEPEKMFPYYEQKSIDLANEAKKSVPMHLQGRFDLEVEKYRSYSAKSNVNWMFEQQNANAVNSVNEYGRGFVDTAFDLVNGEQFLQASADFEEGLAKYDGVISQKSQEAVRSQYPKLAAQNFWAARTDSVYGDPYKFKQELADNELLREKLKQQLGGAKFNTLEKGLDKQITAQMGKQSLDLLINGNNADADMAIRYATDPKPTDLLDANNRVTGLEYEINTLQTNNKDGVFDKQISIKQKQLETAQHFVAIAANRTQHDVLPGNSTFSQLTARIAALNAGYSKKDVEAINAQYQNKKPEVSLSAMSPMSLATAGMTGSAGIGALVRKAAPAGIIGLTNNFDKLFGSKTPSVYAKGTAVENQEAYSDIMADAVKDVANKRLTFTEFEQIGRLNKNLMGNAGYDKIESPENRSFQYAFNTLDDFAAQFAGRNEATRDELRNVFLKDYINFVAMNSELSGGLASVTESAAIEEVKRIKNRWNARLNPTMASLLPGDSFTMPNGVVGKFKGWDPKNGSAIVDTGTRVSEAVANG